MTMAVHSSGISGKGDETVYGGEPAGYVIELENGLRLYHAGYTCAFGDTLLTAAYLTEARLGTRFSHNMV